MTAPSQDTIQNYYDARVDEKLRDFTDFNPRIEAAVSAVAEWAPSNPKRILEIGCGVGATSWRMSRAWPDAEVIGADISPTSIEVANSCFQRRNLTYRAGIIEEGTLEGKFDLILLMDVYEHVAAEDRASLHGALRSLLSDDSRLIMSFPTPTLQDYILCNSPQDLQPVDESIGLEEIMQLATDTATQVVYFRTTGIWHYGDYAHLVLARYRSMADVTPREYKLLSPTIRLKQLIKRLIKYGPTPSERLRDYLGTDVLRTNRREFQARLNVSADERGKLAAAWFQRNSKRA